MSLRTIDLFSGCGGLTLGLERTGVFRSVLAVDFDRHAAETYRVNFRDTEVFAGPIENVTAVPRADVVVGGPPCQGFSALNRDKVGFERRALWREYLRMLDASGAQIFVMENVPDLLRSPEYTAFEDEVRHRQFRVSHAVLDAADFGVPQRRRRAIVIGMRTREPELPERTHADAQQALFGGRQSVADLP